MWCHQRSKNKPEVIGSVNMLIGTYQHNIDAKGRVILPSKFREDLGEPFYITKGTEGCLFVLSGESWEELQNKINAMPISKAGNLQRFFFSSATEVEPNLQGRVLIPEYLREFAGLTKEVTIIGAGGRVEIWDSKKWLEFSNRQTDESVIEAMSLLDL